MFSRLSQCAAVFAVVASAAPSSAQTTHWAAVVVGSNTGGSEDQPLRYAERDAEKIGRVLMELGTVAPQDLVQLRSPRLATVERSFAQLHERIEGWKQEPGARVVITFYFSGHSDGAVLQLGGDRLAWSDLRAMLDGLGADLKLIIVDSCKSGAGVRPKGGTASDAFPIRVQNHAGPSGEIVITSASASEPAFESDEISGSYFTHYFASALRGAGDVSGDRRVTLNEAYRYAFERTVHATELLPSGAQHPSYEYRLSGEGELVMTELKGAAVSLKLPGANRVIVFDIASGLPMVELAEGSAREIGLPPGEYSVRAIRWGQSWTARFTVAVTTHRTLSWSDLSPVNRPKAAEGRSERGMRAAVLRPGSRR